MKKKIFVAFIFLSILLSAFFWLSKKNFSPAHVDVKDYILSISRCDKKAGYNKCLSAQAKNLSAKYSLNEISVAFDKLAEEKLIGSCHDLMHHVASVEYQATPSLPEIFSQCTNSCFNACYHGAVLGYLQEENIEQDSPSKIFEKVSHVCDTLTGEKEIFKTDCVHGVGHALMLVSDNNLPQSLTICDEFSDAGLCYDGVFMENFPNTTTSDHPSEYLKDDDPAYPCNTLDRRYQDSCYIFATTYLKSKITGGNEEYVTFCSSLPSQMVIYCYSSIGLSALGRTTDIEKLDDACELIPTRQGKSVCIKGVVNSYVDRFSGIWTEYFKMFDFCNQVSDTMKPSCFTQVSIAIKKVYKTGIADAETLCKRVDDVMYIRYCLGELKV